MNECSICGTDFDIDEEGGILGDIGILPVAFCPTCKNGIVEFVESVYDMVTRQEAIERGADFD